MKRNYIIKNALIVNEGKSFQGEVFIKDGLIEKVIDYSIGATSAEINYQNIDATGKILIPGLIDDQVHFREPGLTDKADIYTESKAAVAGGITSFMEMPNTEPQTLTHDLLEKKYRLGAEKSLSNYSFYIGASNDNLDEIVKTNPANVCGIKVFMGASTGNMLVNDPVTLNNIFAYAPCLVAVHCEDETTIQSNLARYKKEYGENIPISSHPLIRSEEACYRSSSFAVDLAEKHNTRLHILHLSTARELSLFDSQIPLKDKQITAEVCVHHLWFDQEDYQKRGTFIKWNPAIKTRTDKEALFIGMLDDKLDVIATDHAPHTREEKQNNYMNAPSGGPLVQHSLVTMLEYYHRREISLEKIVEKMCHAPAVCFNIEKRGFIRNNYKADLVLIDLNDSWTVKPSNILYKCGWSPFEDLQFKSKISHTFVNGNLVFENGRFNESVKGERLTFIR